MDANCFSLWIKMFVQRNPYYLKKKSLAWLVSLIIFAQSECFCCGLLAYALKFSHYLDLPFAIQAYITYFSFL